MNFLKCDVTCSWTPCHTLSHLLGPWTPLGRDVAYFMHSFIHSGDLYSASSRDYYSEALPAQSRTKKKDFREM